MKKSYFKFRGRFDFNPHRYEIGNPVIQNKRLENNFFFKKLNEIEESEYDAYFSYHQHFFIKQFPAEGYQFLLYVLDLLDKRIENYDRKDFYTNAVRTLNNLDILKSFREVLMRKGNWDIEKGIKEKLLAQELLNSQLKDKIKLATKFDAIEKINIPEGALPAFIYLIKLIQQLELPSGQKLAKAQSQSPWYKMIGKYFHHGGKEISLDTLRNYFPATKDGKLIKGSEISEENQIFEIIRKDHIS
ncbi:hypothetical protein [Pedobacter sp. L105]|uniref:hypothetical protein n=1 Tax=Pedobacter sp. L105 TaxID=1641871 RepID=UPI00131B40B0|nr:hypothetical protein [Pedobacter sp. L105]